MGLLIAGIIVFVLLLLLLFNTFTTVAQGMVGVVTVFGKYKRVMRPGLNVKIPFIERVHERVSIQNRAVELQFQAITSDQANVYFTAMLLYSVIDQRDETIVNVAFKFVNQQNFMQALIRSVEGTVRSYVATRRQAEILSLRSEIIAHVKDELDAVLEQWGYHLIDLQVNDITFDQAITASMAQVVASNNLKIAATNEGEALLIRKTKEAEASGAFIRISAQAEREASQLQGQGVALFRQEVAQGMAAAAARMEAAHLDPTFILFAMWTEAIRHFAAEGRGNVIFLDGTADGMEKTIHQLMGMGRAERVEAEAPPTANKASGMAGMPMMPGSATKPTTPGK